jgi:hypothetical protein
MDEDRGDEQGQSAALQNMQFAYFARHNANDLRACDRILYETQGWIPPSWYDYKHSIINRKTIVSAPRGDDHTDPGSATKLKK